MHHHIRSPSCGASKVIKLGGDFRFWHKADIQLSSGNVRFWGAKRTSPFQSVMSAFDANRTYLDGRLRSDCQFRKKNLRFGGRLPKTSFAATRSGWAGTLLVWSRFFVTADFDDFFFGEA
jgi:hypothetical protein